MFVYYYTYVPGPFSKLACLLHDHPEQLFATSRGQAHGQGEGVHMSLGVDRGFPLRKDVVTTAGSPDHTPERIILPITAVAAGAPGLFPRLEGEFELAPVDPELTQLTLRGSYRPPLGSVGGLTNQVLLHRVAEAAIKDLVDQVAGRLARALDTADVPIPQAASPQPAPRELPGL